jgi:hypothetical protein
VTSRKIFLLPSSIVALLLLAFLAGAANLVTVTSGAAVTILVQVQVPEGAAL